MHQAAIDLALAAELLAQLGGALQVDGIGHLAIRACEPIHVVVEKGEGRSVDAGRHVGTGLLERRARRTQIRPTRDALKHDAGVLAFPTEVALARGDVVAILVDELLEGRKRLLAPTRHGGDGHVIEKLEPV